MTLDTADDDRASMEQRDHHRRMSAPASYATVTPADRMDAVDSVVPPRRSSLVGAYDYSNHHYTASATANTNNTTNNTNAANASGNMETSSSSFSRRASAVDTMPPPNNQTAAAAESSSRKRTERHHGCETMFSLDTIFSRDLRITGVSKKGSSWRYHIEVLDIRNSLMPFTGSFTTTSTSKTTTTATAGAAASRNSTAASSPASSSVASLNSLPSAPPSSSAFTLPPLVRYSVMRRYNDFRQLYLYLVEYFGPELLDTLPKFPDGGLVSYFRGDDPKLLQYRKEQLQKFLRALDENDDTKWSRAFRVFLNPEIDELSAIGGESFATMVENYGSANSASAAQPLSSSASTSYWDGVGLSRVNANSGYVSLSHVKSPEIRFKKQPVDTRRAGDWKRRKIARANRGENDDDEDEDGYGSRAKKARRVKRLEFLDEPQQENANSDTGDEEEEEDDDDDEDDSPKKSSTDLMQLLSLAPPRETHQH